MKTLFIIIGMLSLLYGITSLLGLFKKEVRNYKGGNGSHTFPKDESIDEDLKPE